uniref:Uncharacterized protein n=1 Tax=Myotis myotis TaxID=51298 RepID=A0A7J7VIR9_MYOMY|nr:hypothetical protein mMyoMyo1_008301 [Myotis myotis]
MTVDYHILVVNRTKHVLVCIWCFIAHEAVMIPLNSYERPKGRWHNSPVTDAETRLKSDLLQVVRRGGDRRRTGSWDVDSNLALSHWPLRAAGILGQVWQPCSHAQEGSQGARGEPSTLERLAGSSCIWELTSAPADMAVTERVRSIRRVLGEFVFSECADVSVREVLISL